MANAAKPARTHLTRAEMEKRIKAGESVIHEGRVISKVEHLPSETDLVIGDADAERDRMRALDRQIEALQAEKVRLAQASAERAQQRAAAEEADEGEDKPKRGRRAKNGRRHTSRKARKSEEAAEKPADEPMAGATATAADDADSDDEDADSDDEDADSEE